MDDYSQEDHKRTYLFIHAKRFAYLLNMIDSLGLPSGAKVLDIGRSPFTKMLAEKFDDVSTLGFETEKTLLDKTDPVQNRNVPHIVYDLNRCGDASSWRIEQQYDLIIFAEVLEHLYVNPRDVFRYLHRSLTPSGVIICQTPNAVSLSRRIKLVLGKNPYSIYDPAAELGSHHFREYTKAEIVRFLTEANLRLVKHRYENYFSYDSGLKAAFHSIASLIPSFRNGQTFVIARRG